MSDPLEELKKIAERETNDAREKADAERRKNQAEQEREAKREAARREDDQRAPGFVGSMRFFGVMFVGMLFVIFGVSLWMDNDTNPLFMWPAVAVWAVVALFFWIDAVTWRGRLPYTLEGYERIAGRDKSGSDRVPYLSFEVSITLDGHENHEAVAKTLEILVQRVNKAMFADKEAGFGGNKVWRVYGGTRACGQATKAVYTTRLIEKWLRKEVRLLHSAVRISRVRVVAEYSGDSYWAPSTD